MVMQIDRNDENGGTTLLTNYGRRKDKDRHISIAIFEIKVSFIKMTILKRS